MKTLIIFARAPILGQVKTRLAKCRAVGKKGALALYRAFLEDAMLMASCTSAQTIAVHFTPQDAEPMMRAIMHDLLMGFRNERRFTFVPQADGGFAQRISHAFHYEARFGGEDLAMIGADAPMIKPSVVNEALDFISEHSGMVLGPSGEGGMYLIGMEAGTPIDFSNVFSEGSELENMILQARAGNIPLKMLPETVDVDVEADLVSLLGLCHGYEYQRKREKEIYVLERTIKALAALRLGVARKGDGATRGKKIVKIDG
ncbi:MAG: DUF2064 domain-containing protein [Nitrospinota bacterium]|nr:DUF2064 domain-containing protein [Nitrospinota bacterium]